MIRGIHHVALSTPDLDRLISFYSDNFQFEVVYQNQWRQSPVIDRMLRLEGSAARVAMLSAGNTHIEIFEYSEPKGAEAGTDRPVCDHGYTHFCLEVDDIEAEYERLLSGGMRFHCPPVATSDSGSLLATYGRDPDGNVIELVEIRDPESLIRLDGSP